MTPGALTIREAAAIYDNEAAFNSVRSAFTARRQTAIERLMAGKAAFLCLDDYSNQWGVAATVFAMGGDPWGVGTFDNLTAYLVWRRSQGKDDPRDDLARKLSRLHPLNPAAERDMAVALTYVASLKQKAPTP